MTPKRSGSILAADFGSVYTRVVLIDLVDGVHRLVAQGQARTTVGYPFDDVGVGLDRVLRDLNERTGRKFVDDDGKIITPEQPDRSGVNYFVATASTGRPMKTVLVGLVADMSIASGLNAASGTYISVADIISLEDGRDEEARLNAILLSRPDLIFITGGTEAGAHDALLELAKVARLAVTLIDAKHRPTVVFAGNSRLAEDVTKLFEDVQPVLVANNVLPTPDEENLDSAQLQLGEAFDEFKEHHGGGFPAVSHMSAVGVLPTAQSYALVAEYLGKTRPKQNVLIVDVGSAASIVSMALDGQFVNRIFTEVGLGHSASTLLQQVGMDRIRRWIPFVTTQVEVVDYALNKTLRPATIPMTLKDMYLEHALLRAAIAFTTAHTLPRGTVRPDFTTIVGTGSGLTNTGNRGLTALLLLDALQPQGVTELYTDPFGLISALGAMAHITPTAAVQLLENGGLERLGTSISLSGVPTPGKPALKARFNIEGEVFEHEIEGGHLWVLPLGTSKRVQVELRVLGRGLHIGGKRRIKLTVEGGRAGLIFDARGRPLPVAQRPYERADQFPLWLSEATGDPMREIDERLLVETTVEEAAAPAASARPGRRQRRGLFGRGGRKPDKKKAAASADDRLASLDSGDDDDFADLLDDDFSDDDELRELRDELSS